MKTARYAKFGEYLRDKRARIYRSARVFCATRKLPVSYPQYSRYESGEQIPGLEQAMAIGRDLEIPVLDLVLCWAEAQADDARDVSELVRGRQWLEQYRTDSERVSQTRAPRAKTQTEGGGQLRLDDVFVFNRSHLKLFETDPRLRDLFTYVNSFSPDPVSPEELGQVFSRDSGVSMAELLALLRILEDSGVLVRENRGYVGAKPNFYFPDDAQFFRLKNLNFEQNVDKLLGRVDFADLKTRQAYRGLVTRELTEAQVTHLVSRLEAVFSEMVELPETTDAHTIYSLCLLLGSRYERPTQFRKRQPNPKRSPTHADVHVSARASRD